MPPLAGSHNKIINQIDNQQSILEICSFHVSQFVELETTSKALDDVKNGATIYT